MNDPQTPKILSLLSKYELEPLWLYQDILVVEGLAHLPKSAQEQLSFLSGLKFLERSQLTPVDIDFLQSKGQSFEKPEVRKQEEVQQQVVTTQVVATEADANTEIERKGASAIAAGDQNGESAAEPNAKMKAELQASMMQSSIPVKPEQEIEKIETQQESQTEKACTEPSALAKETAEARPAATKIDDTEEQLQAVQKTEEEKVPKISLSADPFTAKAELLMHLCKMQSSWELASRELIKCIVHTGYKRGQLFFEPKAGQAIQMHWQKIGKKKLFLGKPAAMEEACVEIVKKVSESERPAELSITDPLLDFYAYDEASKQTKKLAWKPAVSPFEITFLLEKPQTEEPSGEMHKIIVQSAQNAFSI